MTAVEQLFGSSLRDTSGGGHAACARIRDWYARLGPCDPVEKLADLAKPGRPERPPWVRLMAMRKRKTLVVCAHCHQDIHAGRATATTRIRPLESGMR